MLGTLTNLLGKSVRNRNKKKGFIESDADLCQLLYFNMLQPFTTKEDIQIIKHTFVFSSGVPIIDYNKKSVDYWHNPSAQLQNFHSD
jgi:hypothetical protein